LVLAVETGFENWSMLGLKNPPMVILRLLLFKNSPSEQEGGEMGLK
jgi:hypothetical protein